ncbi:hypothetical protein WN51_10218 [Melipona quadrifasciata]|uniref:Uncharacterized protein n=1 Tax=Melipona quadrifasciata TaxID=166423 RepID=A0A0N1ITW0_9HYME|nr:hypothetical protein WN51_10218 [Melipona quadrifasciata]
MLCYIGNYIVYTVLCRNSGRHETLRRLPRLAAEAYCFHKFIIISKTKVLYLQQPSKFDDTTEKGKIVGETLVFDTVMDPQDPQEYSKYYYIVTRIDTFLETLDLFKYRKLLARDVPYCVSSDQTFFSRLLQRKNTFGALAGFRIVESEKIQWEKQNVSALFSDQKIVLILKSWKQIFAVLLRKVVDNLGARILLGFIKLKLSVTYCIKRYYVNYDIMANQNFSFNLDFIKNLRTAVTNPPIADLNTSNPKCMKNLLFHVNHPVSYPIVKQHISRLKFVMLQPTKI